MNALRQPAAMLVVAALLGACAGAPTRAPPTPTPGIDATHMPPPTASPTPSQPEASAPPSPDTPSWTVPMAADGLARVVTDDLVVRSAPGTGPDSIIDPIRAPRDFLVFVLDGPVAADGYDWYKVVTFEPWVDDVVPHTPGIGWLAAAGRDGEPWIAPWDGACESPAVEDLMFTQRLVSLACHGNTALSLEGEYLGCEATVDQGGGADWLQNGYCLIRPEGYEGELISALFLRYSGAPPGVPTGSIVRIAAHLDDPAAVDCLQRETDGSHDLAVIGCRLEIVMTDIEVLDAPSPS